jgi:hypothetical protein
MLNRDICQKCLKEHGWEWIIGNDGISWHCPTTGINVINVIQQTDNPPKGCHHLFEQAIANTEIGEDNYTKKS